MNPIGILIKLLIGVLFLDYMGLLDLSLIYINPTFLTSAIIGGAIMGLGFVIGGFCPGTSICAAAIGKFDAMVFVAGSLVGIYIFMEGYPLIKDIYMAQDMGMLKINEVLGMSSTGFAFLLTFIALVAFMFVTYIEDRVNNRLSRVNQFWRNKWAIIIVVPFIFIFIVGFTPDKTERLNRLLHDPDFLKECNVRTIVVDKFAFELVNNHYGYNVIDVRTPEEYKEYHLPLAINIPLDSMANMEYRSYFIQNFKKNIFYSGDSTTSRRACKFAQLLGKSDNYVLCCPPENFRKMFFSPEMPPEGATKEEVDLYYYRVRTGKQLQELEAMLERFNKPVIKRIRRVQGGCN